MNTQKSITQDFPSAPDVDQDSPQTPQAGSKTGGGETSRPTPGPWFPKRNSMGSWEVNIDSGIYAHSVAYVGRGCPEYFRGDQEANARLIAAAPEVLEALTGLLADVQGLMEESHGVYGLHLNGDVSPWGELEEGGRFERLTHLSVAASVILKATGKESA